MEAVRAESFALLNPLIAQAVAMASHANAFLHGSRKDPPELLGTHSAFRTTFELTFDRLGPGDRPFALADGTAPWLRRLQKEEVHRMHLVLVPLSLERANRIAGLPEPRWGLVTEGDVGTELWVPNWSIRAGVNPKDVSAPWRVSWQAEKSERGFVRGDQPLSEALDRLGDALSAAGTFVRATGMPEEKAAYSDLIAAILDKNTVPDITFCRDQFSPSLFDKAARRAGLLGLSAMGLVLAAGWKERVLAHQQIQAVFEIARASVWRTSMTLIQSAANTLAT